jgi:hypothetical protein
MVAFEDETWTSLYPKVEAEWMEKGEQRRILTPGYNRRRNVFVTLFWPVRYGFVFNRYEKRRSREFKRHLANLIGYAERHGMRKIILFVDYAPCHKTANVRRFIREHPILKIKLLPKRAPKLNPVERKINRPLKAAVCTNRSYKDINELSIETGNFLRKYQRTFGT